MENSICKIVYFDEDSVTDYVQIIAGGALEKTTQLLKKLCQKGVIVVEGKGRGTKYIIKQ